MISHSHQTLPHEYQFQVGAALATISPQDWSTLANFHPLLSYAFLHALEASGSVGEGTGWYPHYLTVFKQQKICGAVPLYLKTHSYGEYVFDWAWADAYARAGGEYYPKLLAAIPFTPITSPRLLCASDDLQPLMVNALESTLREYAVSSVHVNFPESSCAQALKNAGWLQRDGVQFRWQNADYQNFDAFLAALSHDKRKKIKQERKKTLQPQMHYKWLIGKDILESDWDFFYDCYCHTYHEHRSTPYLTREFFSLIGASMPQHLLLIVAENAGRPVAAALNIFDENTLYGRYWGALEFVSGLHFELCYYQAQAFCIAHNIQYFEGGAQGEHKLARGFLPRPTCSFHKMADLKFAQAIDRFLSRERENMAHYANELEERAPFKSPE